MEFTWQSVYKFRVFQFNKALPSSRIIFYYYLLFTTSFIYLPLGFAIIYIFTVTAWRVSLSRTHSHVVSWEIVYINTVAAAAVAVAVAVLLYFTLFRFTLCSSNFVCAVCVYFFIIMK